MLINQIFNVVEQSIHAMMYTGQFGKNIKLLDVLILILRNQDEKHSKKAKSIFRYSLGIVSETEHKIVKSGQYKYI